MWRETANPNRMRVSHVAGNRKSGAWRGFPAHGKPQIRLDWRFPRGWDWALRDICTNPAAWETPIRFRFAVSRHMGDLHPVPVCGFTPHGRPPSGSGLRFPATWETTSGFRFAVPRHMGNPYPVPVCGLPPHGKPLSGSGLRFPVCWERYISPWRRNVGAWETPPGFRGVKSQALIFRSCNCGRGISRLETGIMFWGEGYARRVRRVISGGFGGNRGSRCLSLRFVCVLS
jgi:hypothetical protein